MGSSIEVDVVPLDGEPVPAVPGLADTAGGTLIGASTEGEAIAAALHQVAEEQRRT